MTTKTAKKKVVKKVTKTVAKKANHGVTLTLGQARTIQSALLKAGKNYKFLDTKVNAIKA